MMQHRFIACATALLCQLTASLAKAQDVPAYGSPGGTVSASPTMTQLASSRLPPFRPQLGIGARIGGLWAQDELLSGGQSATGLDLLFRAYSRLTLELSAQVQQSTTLYATGGIYERSDVPLLIGLRVHVGPSGGLVSPFLVAAFGANYARALSSGLVEGAWFAVGQGGVGIEVRITRRSALTFDARAFGRFRPGTSPVLAQAALQGGLLPSLHNGFGVLFNLGVAVYL